MKRSIFIVLIAAIFWSSHANAQCNVEAFANPLEICAGQPVTLWGTGGCGILMYNNFNDGTPGSGWVATTGVQFNNPCGAGPNAIYLWMGNLAPIPRTLTTVNFDVSGVCEISFYLRYAIQSQASPCEGPDEYDEGVTLQYSTNNGTSWSDIAYFRPDGTILPNAILPGANNTSVSGNTPFTVWAQYVFPVPAAAQTPSTRFRWIQQDWSGSGFDHWGIDLVEILCTGTTDVLWSHGATTLDSMVVFPNATTTYTVTVYDTINGLSATDSITIIVNPGPTAAFSASTVCEGVATSFTDQSTPMLSPINSWSWTFGDGNNSNQQNPSNTYGTYGTYDVTLHITDQMGCADDVTQQVTVHAAPQIQFTAQPTSGCSPLTVSFQNQTTVPGGGAVSSYLWNFGNGSTSSATSPSGVFSDGTFDISLTATTAQGCQSSLSMPGMITAHPNPVADFSYSPSENYMLSPVFFQDLSIGASQWNWTFGDGQESNEQNPNHTYQNSGNFAVDLYVANQWGCTDQTSMTIGILSSDIIYFPNAFTPNGDGVNDYFHPLGTYWSSDGYQMRVFNRYGEQIFYTNDLNTPWDGKHMRTGNIVPMGVYNYRVFIRSLTGKEFLFEGQVTVVH